MPGPTQYVMMNAQPYVQPQKQQIRAPLPRNPYPQKPNYQTPYRPRPQPNVPQYNPHQRNLQ